MLRRARTGRAASCWELLCGTMKRERPWQTVTESPRFSVEALVARVRAVLRRTTRAPGGDGMADDGAMLTVGDLELDEEHWVVRRGGTQVELSPTEFRLLAYLMRNQGRMLTRQQLLENVWGWEFAGQSQVVETYVSYLRRKLDPLGPPLIHTQRGVGYSLRPPPEPERAGR